MNKKPSLYFMLVISFCVLTLPTAIASTNEPTAIASTNEPETNTMNNFTPENGPYSIYLFGNLQECYYPSLFHIGPIWFLPNWQYIDFTFGNNPVLVVDGEIYPVDHTITIYGLRGFFSVGWGWTISMLKFKGNIFAVGMCSSIEI